MSAPDRRNQEQYLAWAGIHQNALRMARVLAWALDRRRWFWTDVPRAWYDTFTMDLRALEALGELEVATRSAIAATTYGVVATTEYRVVGADSQMSLLDD